MGDREYKNDAGHNAENTKEPKNKKIKTQNNQPDLSQ